jgi:prolyl 4-hydroxylase
MLRLNRLRRSQPQPQPESNILETPVKNPFLYKECDKSEPYPDPIFYHKFITPQEASLIESLAEKKGFNKSTVGKGQMDPHTRISFTSFLGSYEDSFIITLYKRVRKILDLHPKNYMESLQVVKYEPGGYYRAHYDAYLKRNAGFVGKPREWTLIIYLNDGYEGGETEFPNLGKIFKGQTGDALLFRSLNADNTMVHPNSFHGGLPVTSGIKKIANIWIRSV